MRRRLLRTMLTTDQEGCAVQLDYYLLTEYAAGLEEYGAEIVLRRNRRSERCAVGRITPTVSRMARIIGILAEGEVTPCCLREILEDIL